MNDDRQPNAIDIRDAWKSYDADRVFALLGVTLAIPAGSFVALTGSSGSGKTTLLKLINRLIEPSRGTVWLNGENIAATDAVLLRRRIGYVFQGVGLFPHLTVAENIGITPRLLKWERDAIASRVDELLDLVRLPQVLKSRYPATLSGGQAQRVGIARALAARPGIMLLDEPFGAVDPVTRDALARDYRALHAVLGLTTVMVSHDIMEAILLSDRMAVLESGKLVEYGATPELVRSAANPAVRRLMEMPLRQADRIHRLAGSA